MADASDRDRKGAGGRLLLRGLPPNLRPILVILEGFSQEARRAVMALSRSVPPGFHKAMTFYSVRPGTPRFITAMAGVQEEFAEVLGELPTRPEQMRAGEALAAAADSVIAPLENMLIILYNLRDYCRSTHARDAGQIYQRARVVSQSNRAVREAIASFRAAFSRVSQKAARSRKNKR